LFHAEAEADQPYFVNWRSGWPGGSRAVLDWTSPMDHLGGSPDAKAFRIAPLNTFLKGCPRNNLASTDKAEKIASAGISPDGDVVRTQ